MRRLTAALVILLLSTVAGAQDIRAAATDTFAIRDVALFDGERFVARTTVTVDRGVIAAVGTDIPIAPNVPVLSMVAARPCFPA